MRVVVTGATGYIGQHVVRVLVEQGTEVVALTRSTAPGRFRDLKSDRVGAIRDHLEESDHVIHLAGRLVSDPGAGVLAYYPANVELTGVVMDAAAEVGATSMVHASSRLIYPRTLREPADEERDVAPDTAYGLSKRWAEDLVRHGSQQQGTPAVSLRIAQVTGGRHPGLGVINSFVKQARTQKRVRIHGSGSAVREIVHVDDVARACVAALEIRDTWSAVNIGGTKSITVAEIAHVVAAGAGDDVSVEHIPVENEDLSFYALSTERAASRLNWRPRWTPEDIVREALLPEETSE